MLTQRVFQVKDIVLDNIKAKGESNQLITNA